MIILGTGLTGLVGSRIVELLNSIYQFEKLHSDLREYQQVIDEVIHSSAHCVLHLAGMTDVDRCETEKNQGPQSQAWRINVDGTKALVSACQRRRKRLIYVSTDFVFNGTKDSYRETDEPHPCNFYGLTKYEGEKVVGELGELGLICRISYPYRAKFDKKKDVVRAILERLSAHVSVHAVSDQIIVPTFIDDIAASLDLLLKTNEHGIFHLVGSESITPYGLAHKIAKTFGLDSALIGAILRQDYFRGRAERPYKTVLNNDKIRSLGFSPKGVTLGFFEVKEQLSIQ